MFNLLLDYINYIRKIDPAAKSNLEILLCYPGLHAIMLHRVANYVYNYSTMVGRCISQLNRFITGIEIHPAAKIGKNVFIDHGMGVVIGETTEVGDCCVLYQGVVLGGINSEPGKRHPTLGKNVVVGAGAILLGPIIVGDYAKVGAGSVLLNNVNVGETVVGVPAIPTTNKGTTILDHDGIINPIIAKITLLEQRIIQLEGNK